MSVHCIVCGNRSYKEFCWRHHPPDVKAAATEIRREKWLKKEGKTSKEWSAFRKEWLADTFKPGVFLPCHYCGRTLSFVNATIDHKIPRSRAPHLRYERSNLVPCCWTCNGLKGSVAHDDYKHECYL